MIGVYFDLLTEFLQDERLKKARFAITSLALYLDEATDLSITSQLLLCASFVDADGKFCDQLLEIFDVSEKGATVGASMAVRVGNFLLSKDLLRLVDFLNTDGVSNVCAYPSAGYKVSCSKKLEDQLHADKQAFFTWWCLCHRLNLALQDMLKDPTLK